MIYIASCYFQKNYGSALQAYATQKVLEQFGIDNKTICHDGFSAYIKKRKIKYYITRFYKSDAFVAQIKRYSLVFRRKTNKKFAANIDKRERKFDEFTGKYFSLTEPCGFTDLSVLCENAEAVIVGSDQLWLPSNIYADYYTLSFVPDNVKKISYATSFGISELNKKTKEKCSFLGRFNYISTREETGRILIKSVTDKPCEVVCDPTLLFDEHDWHEMQKENRKYEEEYIFCYFLGNNKWQRKWAKQLKDLTGLKVVSLIHLDEYLKCDLNYADYTPFDIDPADFVNLIRGAEYVCTDSFHATAFSMIFKKKFYTFRRFCKSHSASTNSRLDSLLSKVDLTERIINENTSPLEALKLSIDYVEVDKKLSEFREYSKKWLKKSFEDSFFD